MEHYTVKFQMSADRNSEIYTVPKFFSLGEAIAYRRKHFDAEDIMAWIEKL